jgi:ABC-2 type transport system ATP-binding protein
MARAAAASGTSGREAGLAGPVLDCRGLRRRFGQRLAVDGVGFRIDAGETYGLLGPNGPARPPPSR